MMNILKPFCLVSSLGVAVSGCAGTSGVGVQHEPADASNGCMQEFSVGVVAASVSSTSYNRGCAERALRAGMIQSNDAGVAAVGIRASELAGDIPSEAIDDVVGQLHNPRSQACVVTAKSGNQAKLSCAAPVLVAGGPN